MQLFWPHEGLLLPSHLPSIAQLHERLVGAVLAASQPLLSAKPALAPLFCDLAKTLRAEKLVVALPCQVAPVVPAAVVEEIIHVATRTTSLSAIPTIISPPEPVLPPVLANADASTLLDYVSPPDYTDLIIPYSLMFIWLFAMISVFAFSQSSGSLSRFRRAIQKASTSPRSYADKRDQDVRRASRLSSPGLFFRIPSMTHAVGLLLLSYVVFGGPLPLDFASQLFGDVAETAQSVLPLALKPALVDIFSDLAKTLRIHDLVPLACDFGGFVKDLVLELMSPADSDVFENLFLGYEDLINDFYPIMFIFPLYMVIATLFLTESCGGLSHFTRLNHIHTYVDQEDCRSRYSQPSWNTRFETDYFGYPLPEEELEPIVDEDSDDIPPDALYTESHRYNIEIVVFKFYRQSDNIMVDERTHCEIKSHRVDREYPPNQSTSSRFTEIVEDAVQSVDESLNVPPTRFTPSSDARSPAPPDSTSGEGIISEFLVNLSSSSTVDHAGLIP
ncbi:hypothetical protein H1R20_g9762, partial [Candolleomyces eurysporus]